MQPEHLAPVKYQKPTQYDKHHKGKMDNHHNLG
jgi:hypothetical protein